MDENTFKRFLRSFIRDHRQQQRDMPPQQLRQDMPPTQQQQQQGQLPPQYQYLERWLLQYALQKMHESRYMQEMPTQAEPIIRRLLHQMVHQLHYWRLHMLTMPYEPHDLVEKCVCMINYLKFVMVELAESLVILHIHRVYTPAEVLEQYLEGLLLEHQTYQVEAWLALSFKLLVKQPELPLTDIPRLAFLIPKDPLLLLLTLLQVHGCIITRDNNLNPVCEGMKTILTHMSMCHAYLRCSVNHCTLTRLVITHFMNCTLRYCFQCDPTRQILGMD